MNIRRATVEDAATLASLCHHVQDIHIQARPDIYRPFDDAMLLAEMQSRMESDDMFAFIGEVDGRPIGYVMLVLIDRPASLYHCAQRRIEIDQISIDPDHRSHGYGEALIYRAFEYAKSLNIDHVTLGVLAFNVDAIRFYERLGFSMLSHKMEIEISD